MTATRAESFAEPHAELPELTIFRPRVLADARGDFRELFHAEVAERNTQFVC